MRIWTRCHVTGESAEIAELLGPRYVVDLVSRDGERFRLRVRYRSLERAQRAADAIATHVCGDGCSEWGVNYP